MTISVATVARIVARHYGITHDEIIGPSRKRRCALPRHVAMYFAREFTAASLPLIGRSFGGKDHTTVIHALNRVRRLTADGLIHLASLRVRLRYLAELHELDALSGRVYLAAEQQAQWNDPVPAVSKSEIPVRDLSGFRTDRPVPSALYP